MPSDAGKGSSVTFLPDSEHVALSPNPGCDEISVHMAMSMWNPALADEMLVRQCPFPFDPESVSMEGGTEDLSLDAPFEPLMYQDIFDAVAREEYGICAVTRVPEPSTRGFVYGFGVPLKDGGCADGDPNVMLTIREYASRAHRDEAAHSTERIGSRYVLGRWVIELSGDASAARPLHDSILALGAAQLA